MTQVNSLSHLLVFVFATLHTLTTLASSTDAQTAPEILVSAPKYLQTVKRGETISAAAPTSVPGLSIDISARPSSPQSISTFSPQSTALSAAAENTTAFQYAQFLSNLSTSDLDSDPSRNCSDHGGGCEFFNATLSGCVADDCACKDDLSLSAMICAECLGSKEAVMVYNTYLSYCQVEGVSDPTDTFSVSLVPSSSSGEVDGEGAGVGQIADVRTGEGGGSSTDTSTVKSTMTQSPGSTESTDDSSTASSSASSSQSSTSTPAGGPGDSTATTSSIPLPGPEASPVGGGGNEDGVNMIQSPAQTGSPSAAPSSGQPFTSDGSVTTPNSAGAGGRINALGGMDPAPGSTTSSDGGDSDDSSSSSSSDTRDGGVPTTSIPLTIPGSGALSGTPNPSDSAAEPTSTSATMIGTMASDGSGDQGLDGSSALAASKAFFNIDAGEGGKCGDKCSVWKDLVSLPLRYDHTDEVSFSRILGAAHKQRCTKDECICTAPGVSSAASCSACVGANATDPDPEMQQYYSAFMGNCSQSFGIQAPSGNTGGSTGYELVSEASSALAASQSLTLPLAASSTAGTGPLGAAGPGPGTEGGATGPTVNAAAAENQPMVTVTAAHSSGLATAGTVGISGILGVTGAICYMLRLVGG